MKKSKLIILSSIIPLAILSFVLYKILSSNEQKSQGKGDNVIEIINVKFGLTLSPTTEILGYSYNIGKEGAGSFGAKLLIEPDYVYDLINELDIYFEKNHVTDWDDSYYHFENVYTWWDLDKNRVLKRYCTLESNDDLFGETTVMRTITCFAYIAKQNDDNYYLYLSVS